MSLTHLGKFLTKVERAKKLCQCLSLREAWKRGYSIQPPDWLGGKSMFDFSGQYDFPEHSKSFDERIKGACNTLLFAFVVSSLYFCFQKMEMCVFYD